MTARLHCFGESGHSYKAALAMTLAGYPWEPVFVDFFNGATRREPFLSLNPMGECPVLEEDGEVVTQSGLILVRIARRTGRLFGTPADEDEIWRWILWDNHRFSGQIGVTRFLMNFLPPERRPAEVIAWQQGRLRGALRILENHLAGRDWVVGRDVTVADLSCASYLFYDEPFGFRRADWPAIDRWLDRIAALPGWRHPYDLMPGRPSDRAREDG
ncbi:MAG: glutathione binding-like protein [Rhodobacteraceae bacterium]|nr:glutathione binding-like protein [Paracoccaceae bacterium]